MGAEDQSTRGISFPLWIWTWSWTSTWTWTIPPDVNFPKPVVYEAAARILQRPLPAVYRIFGNMLYG